MRALTVMLVDDEPDIRLIAEVALAEIGGCEVSCLESGMEALGMAAMSPPDVILLDAMMPELDGPETLAALRELEETRSIPVIFLTARASPEDKAEYLRLGAIGVIEKPFDPTRLADQVKDLLAATGALPKD